MHGPAHAQLGKAKQLADLQLAPPSTCLAIAQPTRATTTPIQKPSAMATSNGADAPGGALTVPALPAAQPAPVIHPAQDPTFNYDSTRAGFKDILPGFGVTDLQAQTDVINSITDIVREHHPYYNKVTKETSQKLQETDPARDVLSDVDESAVESAHKRQRTMDPSGLRNTFSHPSQSSVSPYSMAAQQASLLRGTPMA